MNRPLAGERPGTPRVLVFSSLFPSAAAPLAGLFIRERMFRVARQLPMVVVAPQPWSPLDAVVRCFRPSFRPVAASYERMQGVDVYRPRFLSLPGMLKSIDGWSMAAGAHRVCRRIARQFGPTVVDAHFLYPDGFAATLIGSRLGLPVVITVRGSKDEWLIGTPRERFLRRAMARARRLIAVSDALRRSVVLRLGQPEDKAVVIGNGVDTQRFEPVPRQAARRVLGLPADAPVLVSVGGLTENKGFHRVIELLPALRRAHPGLIYVIVGGGTPKGDQRARLEALALERGVADAVRFLGPKPPDELKWCYGAADLFVLATAFEGWANVFLEAMACGIPVVTTDVGGNAEVVCRAELGTLVPYWDGERFAQAILDGLHRRWDPVALRQHALDNSWDRRVSQLIGVLRDAGARP